MYSAEASGNVVRVKYFAMTEMFFFDTEEEARQRVAIANEAMSWVATPFVNCADVKGKNGGVDCAMLLVRSYVDSGVLPQFDPRPYDPQWYLHNSDPVFLDWITEKLHGVEIQKPRLGDVAVFFFGMCFAHGAIYIGCNQVVHAYSKGGSVFVCDLNDTAFSKIGRLKRPVKFFEVRR